MTGYQFSTFNSHSLANLWDCWIDYHSSLVLITSMVILNDTLKNLIYPSCMILHLYCEMASQAPLVVRIDDSVSTVTHLFFQLISGQSATIVSLLEVLSSTLSQDYQANWIKAQSDKKSNLTTLLDTTYTCPVPPVPLPNNNIDFIIYTLLAHTA